MAAETKPQERCPKCGQPVRADMKQCPSYGTPLCDD
jgi:hypothetical protein